MARKKLSGWRVRVWSALIIPGIFAGALAAEPAAPALGLWSFEEGIYNAWAGRYNVYQREPSWARTYLDPRVARSGRGHSLRITAHKAEQGFCGVWLDLAGGAASPKKSQDAKDYAYLSFWIKGERGGEDFEFTLADAARAEDSESLASHRLAAYLPGGVTAAWQEVLIPLADFPELDLSQLARIILHFTAAGDYRFYLDEVALKPAKASPPSPQTGPGPKPASADLSRRDQSMWVWNTPALFDDGELDRLLAFCSAHRVREVHLSVEFSDAGEDSSRPPEVQSPERVRHILERAHQKGLKVDALAGTPEWAMEKNHSKALAAADAVLRFNKAAPPAGRFDGVHFDVEPYLLLGYDDPSFGRKVREDFLEMVSRLKARVSAEPGLRFSCDVPSWFYPADEAERREVLATFQGKEKAVGEHLTDLLDTVTIMDYINQADGAGGIIARGIPALQYAASQGKKIAVGVETFLEPDRAIYFASCVKKEDFPKRLADSGLSGHLYFENRRLAAVSDGATSYLGLSAPVEMTDSQRAQFNASLLRLVSKFNGANGGEPDAAAARAALAKDPDWRGFETFEIPGAEGAPPLRGFRGIRRMSPRITFHGLGAEVFEEEARSSDEWLSRYPAYGGLAVHFYDSYRELLEGK